MAGLARVWLALAGLVAGTVNAGEGVLVATAAVAAAGCCLPRRGPWRAIAVVAAGVALGGTNATVRSVAADPAAVLARSVPSCEVVGRTLEEAGGLGVLVAIDQAQCGDRPAVVDAGAAFLDDFPLPPGRRFTATGWLVPLAGEGFDLARRRAGAAAALRVTAGRDVGPVPGVHAFANRVRDALARAAVPLGTSGALLRGLTIGDTSTIDPATEESLRRSGLAHLLAVSGSNVAILLGAVAVAASRVSLKARTGCCAAALAAFVAVVGPDASVLRAAGMGAVALVAVASGRRAEPLHALGLALLGVVALRPGIVYSAGLHLSVAATAGIVLWGRPLAARLWRLPRPLAAVVGATVAAQIAVAPLLVATFGEISVAALPANVLAVPAVAPATVLGLASGAAGTLLEVPARALALAASPFSGWILRVAEALGEPAWASPPVPEEWGPVLAVPVVAAAIRSVPRKLRGPARNLVAEPQPEGSLRRT